MAAIVGLVGIVRVLPTNMSSVLGAREGASTPTGIPDLAPLTESVLNQPRPRGSARPAGRVTTAYGAGALQAPLPAANLPVLPQAPLATTTVPTLPQAPLPAASEMPAPQNGLFQERPSQQEQPQLTMTNGDAEAGSVYLKFQGPVAKSVCIPPYQTVTVEMPMGEYSFWLWGDSSSLQTGYAVFRRRHEYEATWVTVSHSRFDPVEPIRLGDVQ